MFYLAQEKTLTGILCTLDTLKHDAEIKYLFISNPEEKHENNS